MRFWTCCLLFRARYVYVYVYANVHVYVYVYVCVYVYICVYIVLYCIKVQCIMLYIVNYARLPIISYHFQGFYYVTVTILQVHYIIIH